MKSQNQPKKEKNETKKSDGIQKPLLVKWKKNWLIKIRCLQ